MKYWRVPLDVHEVKIPRGEIHLIVNRCKGCEFCVEYCPRDVLEMTDDFNVKGEITAVRTGPVVTMYELEPAPGLKASRVIGLADDIARSMSALSARVSTVPGRSVIGIELPNDNREMVLLREILSARFIPVLLEMLPVRALRKEARATLVAIGTEALTA